MKDTQRHIEDFEGHVFISNMGMWDKFILKHC